MLGLGNYASSDGEDESEAEPQTALAAPARATEDADDLPTKARRSQDTPVDTQVSVEPDSQPEDENAVAAPVEGPKMPADNLLEPEADTSPATPSYANTAEALRSLTMPPVPNFDIPPSPPGSPPLAATKRIANYLKLKKAGTHFNERLAKSEALKNPSLYQRLKEHAGISDQEQYATTLPEDLAVPTAFPPWAYADELAKSQVKVRARKEAEKKKRPRDKVEFVSETILPSHKLVKR